MPLSFAKREKGREGGKGDKPPLNMRGKKGKRGEREEEETEEPAWDGGGGTEKREEGKGKGSTRRRTY